MNRIWKYELAVKDKQEILMPQGAEILNVASQYGSPVLWALVDPSAAKETRRIATYGTGNPIEGNPGKYIGTYLIARDSLVFHVFEVRMQWE